MPVVQVVIDDSTYKVITGTHVFDAASGGTLSGPAGASFPVSAENGAWFWNTTDGRLYRYNGATWIAVFAGITTDDKVKHNSGDPTNGYLDEKLMSGVPLVKFSAYTPDGNEADGSLFLEGTTFRMVLSGVKQNVASESYVSATAAPIAHVGATGSAHGVATTGVNGFMSSSDKSKLDGVTPGATNTPLSNSSPANVTKAAASAGVATDAARSDHKHDIATAVPVAIGASSSEGSSTSLARADHVHSHGDQAGGTTHALATDTVNGFLSAANKVKLDGITPGATATPLSNVSPVNVTKAAASAGASTEASRADHKHDISTAAPGNVGASNAEGSSTSLARADHTHAHGTHSDAAAHAVATTGANGFMASTDKSKLDGIAPSATNTPLTATAPVNVTKDAAAVGVSSEAARSDHKHDVSTAAPSNVGASNSEGAATSLSRSDHVHAHGDQAGGTAHSIATTGASGFMSGPDKTKLDGIAPSATNTPLSSTAPENVTKATAAVGVSSSAARSDHKHDIATAAPSSVGTSNSEGSSTSLARADHVHSHGNQAGGSLHAAATTSVDGFMSSGDKAKLDGISAGAQGWAGFDDTDVTITNSTTETPIFSRTIPADTLPVEGQMLQILAIGQVTCVTTARSLTLRLKIGGTTIYADSSGNFTASATDRFVSLEIWLVRTSATTADLIFNWFVGNAGAATTGAGDIGSAAFRSVSGRTTRNFSFNFSAENTLSATVQLATASTAFTYAHDAVYFFAPGGGEGGGTSPLTTKGDIYTRSTSTDARLPVGADGQILSADSSEPNGLKWIASQAGYNHFTASMNAEQASAPCYLCKNPDNQSNPGGLAVSHGGNLFKNGYLDPFLVHGDQEIIEIGIICAGAATGFGTVGASPTIRVDCYNVLRDSEVLLTTQRAVIVGSPVIGIWNNLSTSTGLVMAVITLASPVSLPHGTLFGFRLIPENSNDTQINAVAMPRVSVKTRYV